MNDTFFNIFWAIIGAVVGITAADIDIAPPIPLKHCSAWTHGPLVPALVLLLVRAYPAAWAFAVAFMFAFAVHLMMDCFPGRWKGSALINLFPVPMTLPPLLSFLYLVGGVVSAVWVAFRIMDWPLLEILQRWI